MKVLETWLKPPQRHVLLSIDKDGGWIAEAAICGMNGDVYVPHTCSGGADARPLPTLHEALESLDEALAAEAGQLLSAQSRDEVS